MQAINVAFGGTLCQDIGSQMKSCLQHMQQAPRYNATHKISVEKDSFLESVLGREAMVNSFHHQSVKAAASGFRVTARADDGVIEGIERTGGSFICGVQWHPEMMAKHDNKTMIQLFQALLTNADNRRKTNEKQKEFGLISIILLGMNAIIGSGIFLLPGQAYDLVGTSSLFVFLFITLLAGSLALCFAEAAGLFKSNGAAYIYAKEAFGNFAGFEVGFYEICGTAHLLGRPWRSVL